MNLTSEMAQFEVRGTRYGRTMVALETFKWAGLGFVAVGLTPALWVGGLLPGAWRLLAWAWAVGCLWLAVRWARRRTRVWSLVSPDGIAVHCGKHEQHVAWSDLGRVWVVRMLGLPMYIALRTRDGDRIQVAAAAGNSAAVVERIIAYARRVTNGAWTPEPNA